MMLQRALSIIAIVALSGCSSVPPYDLLASGPPSAPSGPKVAALLANLKCELWVAVHNEEEIPRYIDDPSLPIRYDPNVPGQEHHPHSSNPERWFTLKNLSEEIEFVGEAQYQLDVTSTPSLNASTNFIRPYAGSASLTLAVNGSLSEAAHRNLVIYSTIDFERLIKSPPHRGARDTEGPVAKFAPTPEERTGAAAPTVPCNRGTELGGFLGLQEDLTYHAITADMNDLSVWPAANNTTKTKIQTSDFFSKWGVDVIQITVDFTVNANASGGPSWVLTHFKGPAGSPSLFNYTNNVKDTLTLTIIPICIRQKYKALNKTAPFKYDPQLIEGTPRWGNFLPPCSTASAQLKGQAVSTARTINTLKLNNPAAPIIMPP